MPRLTPEQIVDKQIRNAQNAVEDLVGGIERMKETPGQAAVRKKEKYRQGVLRALESGDWEAGMNSYTLQEFKDVTIPKIRERYASGVNAARAKTLEARRQLSAYQDQLEKEIRAMPNDTEAQRDARLLANLKGMRKFKLARKRR